MGVGRGQGKEEKVWGIRGEGKAEGRVRKKGGGDGKRSEEKGEDIGKPDTNTSGKPKWLTKLTSY